MNIGCHKINDMLKFAGHCRSIVAHAMTNGHIITPNDVLQAPAGMGTIAGEHIIAALQFDDDVTGTLLHDQFDPIDFTGSVMEFYGSKGRFFRHGEKASWLPQPHFVPGERLDRWENLAPTYPEHYDSKVNASADDYWFVDEYVRALDEGREHECSGFEARHVVEVMMGIFESAAYGIRVNLPQRNREHPLLRWRSESGLSDPPRHLQQGTGAEGT